MKEDKENLYLEKTDRPKKTNEILRSCSQL